MEILGLDIGGANLKAIKLSVSNGKTHVKEVIREYFPVWILGKNGVVEGLKKLKKRVNPSPNYVVSTTMTAELSDLFRNKSEGVRFIVRTVEEVFSDASRRFYVNVKSKLVGYSEAYRNPLEIAAANWAASAWLISKKLRNCIFVDIGSTSTTIVPIINGEINVQGYTDPEKLVYGELVYLGVLRTNVCSIVDKVPYKGLFARISSEKFALSGDVCLVLGKIGVKDYTTETADGRGRNMRECLDRLSRVPCADNEILNDYEILEIARYVYESMVFRIFEALIQVRSRIASLGYNPSTLKVCTAGLGSFLAKEAAKRAGFKDVIDVSSIYGKKISHILPAYAVALMALEVLGK
ncbi:MAG TPA: H4MPT-linked C1 transfer pathway protein [Acidilobales archaeon]|nr:H4MPT-linked C1 transfer pathway protein [Acidilobales archaeon]